MKYHQIIVTLPRLLSAGETQDYVCGMTILKLLTDEHGLKPVIRGKGLTVYDRTEIDLAIERLKLAERRKGG